MQGKLHRRGFLKGAAALTGTAALSAAGLVSARAEDPEFKVRVKVKGEDDETKKSARPLLYGAGMIWAQWLNRPKEYDAKQMDRLVDLGATLTSATFDWVDRERTEGQWDWSYPDHAVALAQERGLKQFGYVGNTPGWALPEGVDPKNSYRFPPADKYRKQFENYCRTTARRYKGKVDLFQFWNEPNGCSWVKDGCANGDQFELYTKWLRIAYAALKEGNPRCIVAAGALDYNEGVKEGYKYIEGMYGSGAKGFFDAISIHPYDPQGLHWKAVQDTHRVMKDNGDGEKGVWITEYGWADAKGEEPAKKLRDVLTRLATDEYSYLTLANYLCVTDLPIEGTEQYGLCDRELNPRPIGLAFKDIAKAARSKT